MITDPIADLITRIRNAYQASHLETTVLYSKMNVALLEVLKKGGYIADFKEGTDDRGFKNVVVSLVDSPATAFTFKRVSKPGQRIYKGVNELRPVRNGLGIQVVSTPQGVMTATDARKKNIGGEVLIEVY